MKLFTSFTLFIFGFSLFISCSKSEPTIELKGPDCEFVQDDDAMDGLLDSIELAMMETCRENPLTSVEAIKNNLIGEWELVGFGAGWSAQATQPCGYIIFTEDELIYEFENADTKISYQSAWDVEDFGSGGFSLTPLSGDKEGLVLNQFCEQFMYGPIFIFDVDKHIYQKVN